MRKRSHRVETRTHPAIRLDPAFGRVLLFAKEPIESVINEIEFKFEQIVSIRTDVKLNKDDLRLIISELPQKPWKISFTKPW